jgi:hypothetical protein
MSSTGSSTQEVRTIGVALLAETVAARLHSMAQPLTAAHWRLESAAMPSSSTERREVEIIEAQVALERVVEELDFLRDIIRPFRAGTEFITESMREALVLAGDMQSEALQNEGVEVDLSEGCAQGKIVAPRGFVQRVLLCLFGLLRSVAPVKVSFDIRESAHGVQLVASLVYPAGKEICVHELQTVSTIRSYVEVLMGEFSITPDLSSIRIWLPRACSST